MKKLLFTIWFCLIPIIGLSSTIDTEIVAAIKFLEKVSPEDRPFIRFFSLYSLPTEELKQRAALSLTFVCHSLIGISDNPLENTANINPLAKINEDRKFEYRTKIPNSDLLWFDLRWYNWEREDYEFVTSLEPFFIQPFIQNSNYEQLKLLTLSNPIIRADWAIINFFDQTKQSDIGISPSIYEALLYSKQNKIPTTIDDFQKIWAANIEQSQQLAVDSAALSIDSFQVSRHNRILFQYRTPLGYFYKTFDVQSEVGEFDLIENIFKFKGFPPKFGQYQAGESISTNIVGLQVYALYNGNDGKLINFGDPTVVRNTLDPIGDIRVRAGGFSCTQCHATGLNSAINVLSDNKEYLNIIMPDYNDRARLERVFERDKFNKSVEIDKEIPQKALLEITGLTPEENLANLITIWKWYHKPLTLQQILLEVGTTEENLREKINKSWEIFGIDKVPARLKLAIKEKNPIPITRESWDSNSKTIPGIYQQTMTILHGLTAEIDEYIEPLPQSDPTVEIEIEVDSTNLVVAKQKLEVKSGNKTIFVYNIGNSIELTGNIKQAGGFTWTEVRTSNGIGYIRQDLLR